MADSGETAEPVFRVPVGTARREISHPWRKGWRSVFLFGATVVLALLGFICWLAAAAGKEDASLEAGTPQLIGVFSTDPNATIHLTAVVVWRNVSGFAKLPFEQVYVSATVPHPKSSSAILITSSVRPIVVTGASGNQIVPDTLYKSAIFYNGSKPFSILDGHEYVTEFRLKSIEQGRGNQQSGMNLGTQYGVQIGLFELPPVTQESHGSFFAHLPDIGFGPTAFDPLPFLISELSSSSQPGAPNRGSAT